MSSLDDDFSAYQRRVTDYARSWHITNAAAREALAIPEVRARVVRRQLSGSTVETSDVYKIDGRWVPARVQVQEDLLASLVGLIGPIRADLPLAVMLFGLPGSGKSSGLRPYANALIHRLNGTDGSTLDADMVRERFPEYAAGLGSEVVQTETSYLTYSRIRNLVLMQGGNLVLDLVGDADYAVADIKYLSDTGWSVVCLLGSVDVDVAILRAKQRALDNGRFVPPEYIESVDGKPRAAYEAIRDAGLPVVAMADFDLGGPRGAVPIVLDTDSPEIFGPPGAPTILPGRP